MKTQSTAPLVDVFVHTYNHETSIARCLQSIVSQNYRPLRITVIDDSSNDRTSAICDRFARKFPDILNVKRTPSNAGSALAAIALVQIPTSGNYWCSVDGDDEWCDSDKLVSQVAMLEKSPQLAGCSGVTKVFDETGRAVSLTAPRKSPWSFLDWMERNVGYVHSSSVIWRASHARISADNLVPGATGWPEGDWPRTLFFLLRSGKKLHHLDRVVSHYNMTGKGVWSSLTVSEMASRNQKMREEIMMLAPARFKFLVSARKAWAALMPVVRVEQ